MTTGAHAQDPIESPFRIAFVITKADHGGAQEHVLHLARGLHGAAHCAICVGETGFLTDEAAAQGIEVRVIKELTHPIRPSSDLRAVKRLSEWFDTYKPDIVHAHTSKAGVVARLAGRLSGVPVIYTPHGWSFSERSGVVRRTLVLAFERLLSSLSAGVIAVSNNEAELGIAQSVCRPPVLRIIHNGIDSTAPQSVSTSRDVPQIVMVARMAPPKDPVLLLKALSEVTEAFHLTLVGDGPSRSGVEAAINRLKLAGKVELAPSNTPVRALLSRSDIFVLTSRYEAFPISILEAMRAGLPVVATAVGGVPEAVIEGQTGFLVPYGDPETLRARLVTLLRSSDLRARLGSAGKARFLEHFTAPVMVSKTLSVYQGILDHRQAALPPPGGGA